MSAARKERILRQIERIRVVFDKHLGGVPRGQLAMEATVPETSLPSLLARMRAQALDWQHVPKVLKIGGQWIYGWAGTMDEHYREHHKRRKNERRALLLSVTTLEQSTREYPESEVLREQLRTTRHRLEDVEAHIEQLAGVLDQLRSEAA